MLCTSKLTFVTAECNGSMTVDKNGKNVNDKIDHKELFPRNFYRLAIVKNILVMKLDG